MVLAWIRDNANDIIGGSGSMDMVTEECICVQLGRHKYDLLDVNIVKIKDM